MAWPVPWVLACDQGSACSTEHTCGQGKELLRGSPHTLLTISPSLAAPAHVVLNPLHYLQCLEGSHVAPVRESGQLQAESGKENLHAHDFEIQPVCPYLGDLVRIFDS